MDKLKLLAAVAIVQFVCGESNRSDIHRVLESLSSSSFSLTQFPLSPSGIKADCPKTVTRPHSTQCNQYIRCVELPSNIVSWITMKCQEGLIYDKNLRSCAIPGDAWECIDASDTSNDFEQDEANVYGIENLDVIQDEPETPNDEDFLEVIGEKLDDSEPRSEDEEIKDESEAFDANNSKANPQTNDGPEARIGDEEDALESSGDGVVPESVTQPTQTSRMITTQLQRLTQLMQHVQDKNNGVIDDEDVTPEDLNSFLATQKIHSNSLEYQKTDFQSNDKTPMPANGRIHPEILSDILDQQNQLNSEANRLTTLAMDATTQKYPQRRPTFFGNKDPITEIKMKSAQSIDGSGSHQIVVNRPEGSVLFNVPPSSDQSHQPYLSQDILKTILEISKQMVTQNHQKQNPQVSYAPPQPFYYAVPVPYLSPQNNVPSFYSQDYRNNLTEAPVKKKTSVELIPSPSTTKLAEKIKERLPDYFTDYNLYQNPSKQQPHQQAQQFQIPTNPANYQNPNYYYHNYPSYSNGFQSYQNYQPTNNYQYPAKNQYRDPVNYNQQFNYDGDYYDRHRTRPFVMDSSAPSYVEQLPIRKESYATYEEEKIDDNLYDDAESDEPLMNPDKEELICSYVVQRQANRTDCYRYYVCNAKTKEILSYTCPIFTAFNDQTKYCDALSYPACQKTKDRATNTFHNKKIMDEAHKALEQVKMETQKVERIAQQVRKESQKIYTRRNPYQEYQNVYENDLGSDYQPTSIVAQVQKVQKPFVKQQPINLKPFVNPKPKPIRKSSKTKRKKVKCRSVGNIIDPESPSSYWHCFKGPDGRMKRINKKCSQNFIFCPSTRYCSPDDRCSY